MTKKLCVTEVLEDVDCIPKVCVHIGGTLLLEKEYQTRYISDVSDVIIDIVVVQLPTYLTYLTYIPVLLLLRR